MSTANYELIIGIETHVQLRTKTKLFCGCDNDSREAGPNTNVCPVCMGFPGALPVLNEQAVKLALRAGLALGAEQTLLGQTKFDRKNYFYPDLPSGYQITQFDEPIVGEGLVNVPDPDNPGQTFAVGITRAHLEADAGKLNHPDGANYSLVDLNRSGTPLIEIVSEPDIRLAAQAKAYATEIYKLMLYNGVSDADLYYGNMRFDVNVSVRPTGTKEFGTRTETKNLNSFRAVEKAVEYEFARQVALLEKGERIVQETRGWNDAKQITYSQRSKEDAHDYRYFPEPDLPPILITEKLLDEAKTAVPASLGEIRQQLLSLGVPADKLEALIDYAVQFHGTAFDMLAVYLKAAKPGATEANKRMALWMVGPLRPVLADLQAAKKTPELTSKHLTELISFVDDGKLNSNAIDIVLKEATVTGKSVAAIAEAKKLIQVSDTAELEKLVVEVIAANPQVVAQYQAGETKVMGFLVGQVMKASAGQANPGVVNGILSRKLGA